MGVISLPKTVTRQRRGCDMNLGPSAPESSMLNTRLPSHPIAGEETKITDYTIRLAGCSGTTVCVCLCVCVTFVQFAVLCRILSTCCLQCFDAVGWVAGRASGL